MENKQEHLVEMMKKFDAGMLVTKTQEDGMHGRPMEVAKVDGNGVLYCSTSLNSPKLYEIENDSSVSVFFQQSRSYVAVYGTAEIVKDQRLIDELWQESWRVWFPDGKESPDLCLLRITPHEGEYWDMTGQRGARFLFEAAKAYLTGTKPDRTEEGNAKVSLHS